MTRTDVEPRTDFRHITLQRTCRTCHAISVFQGAVTLHLDPDNSVYRALGDIGRDTGHDTGHDTGRINAFARHITSMN